MFMLLCVDSSSKHVSFCWRNYVHGDVLETRDFTKRIPLLPHGMGEYDPTDLVGRLYRVVR